MKIGILQTGRAPESLMDRHPDYDQMFVRLLSGCGFTFETVPVLDGTMPNGPRDADGWLITGSKCGVYEDHAWIPPLESFIRDIRDSQVPLLGICFGHQIVAQALGAKVEKFSGGWSLGPVEYAFTEPDETLTIQAFHQDQVLSVPEGARVIAKSDFCEYAGFAYDDWALTIQPHPEFSAQYVRDLFGIRWDVLPEDRVAAAEAKLDTPLSTERLRNKMARFFLDRRG